MHTDVTLTADGSFTGGHELHTGRLFFGETITTRVAALATYAASTVPRTTLAQDGIHDDAGAASGLLTLTALGSSASAGCAGTLTLGAESQPAPTRPLRPGRARLSRRARPYARATCPGTASMPGGTPC